MVLRAVLITCDKGKGPELEWGMEVGIGTKLDEVRGIPK